MSEPVTAEQTWEDDTLEERDDVHEPEPIRRRPRRRLLTPLTALLFAILVGISGFIAGVEVEKNEMPTGILVRRGGGFGSGGAFSGPSSGRNTERSSPNRPSGGGESPVPPLFGK
ncbi:MAG TPA: hypothetical protein VID70_06560 [Solirubrobacteraceae bacterium]|jgi:hypothetical protein